MYSLFTVAFLPAAKLTAYGASLEHGNLHFPCTLYLTSLSEYEILQERGCCTRFSIRQGHRHFSVLLSPYSITQYVSQDPVLVLNSSKMELLHSWSVGIF